jgi:AcrR family transcriptional regulator
MKNKDSHIEQQNFYTKTFEAIDVNRRETILNAACAEFANKGFNGAGIKSIARKANISIGSLYSYFPSKENLFLALADQGQALLEKAYSDIDLNASVFEIYRSFLYKICQYAKTNPELNLIYLEATTQGLRHLAKRLSGDFETAGVKLYKKIIAIAIRRGELRADIDPGTIAFFLDNLIVMLQFSLISDYQQNRLRIFIGLDEDEPIDEDLIIDKLLDFVRRAVGKGPQPHGTVKKQEKTNVNLLADKPHNSKAR